MLHLKSIYVIIIHMTQTLKQVLEYPKILCFMLSCAFASLLFHYGAFDVMVQGLNGHGYISIFIAGLLFSFGFTTPFAIAIFITASPQVDLLPAMVIGGVGALLSDVCIFEFVRFSMADEFEKLSHVSVVQRIHALFHHEQIPEKFRLYMLWSVAGMIIASPLPDEIGVTLLSGAMRIETRKFALICFIFNSLGILFILSLARVV